mgnify:CR=1 FL=1
MPSPRYLFCAECHFKLATRRVTRLDPKAEGSYGLCEDCLREHQSHPLFSKLLRLHAPTPGPLFADERWDKTPASIIVSPPVTADKLAALLGVKPYHLIAMLVPMKCFVTADKPLPPEVIQRVAEHYDTEILIANDTGWVDLGP